MRAMRVVLGLAAAAGLAGCDVLSDPAYWDGTYGGGAAQPYYGNPYDNPGVYRPPCDHYAPGGPAPGCRDYVPTDEYGNPLPPVIVPSDDGAGEAEPEAE